jgi:multiple sugar transport system permease protein
MKSSLTKPASDPLGYLFTAPTVLLVAVFLISPLFAGLVQSFYKTSLTGVTQWAGVKNYYFLITEDRFLNNLLLSGLYVMGNLLVSLPLAYCLALLITRPSRGAALFRTVFLLPWVVAPVVSTVFFRSLVEPNFGLFSLLLTKITGHPHVILAEPFWALTTIVGHSVWRSLPFMTLFLSAGVTMIPRELYEASRVDGAGSWRQFWNLTLPMTRRHLFIVLLTVTLWTLQDTETVYAMTEGGPGYSTEVMAVRLFKESFLNFDLNQGATLGVLLLITGMVFLIAYARLVGRGEE